MYITSYKICAYINVIYDVLYIYIYIFIVTYTYITVYT